MASLKAVRQLFKLTDARFEDLHEALLVAAEESERDDDTIDKVTFVTTTVSHLLSDATLEERVRAKEILEGVFDFFCEFTAHKHVEAARTTVHVETLAVGFQRIRLHGDAEETCRALFDVYDVNDSNVIDAFELHEFHEHSAVFANACLPLAERQSVAALEAHVKETVTAVLENFGEDPADGLLTFEQFKQMYAATTASMLIAEAAGAAKGMRERMATMVDAGATASLKAVRQLFKLTDARFEDLHEALLVAAEESERDDDTIDKVTFVTTTVSHLLSDATLEERVRAKEILEGVFDFFCEFTAHKHVEAARTTVHVETLAVGFQRIRLHGDAEETCRALFDVYDVNDSDFIDASELHEFHEHSAVFANACLPLAERQSVAALEAHVNDTVTAVLENFGEDPADGLLTFEQFKQMYAATTASMLIAEANAIAPVRRDRGRRDQAGGTATRSAKTPAVGAPKATLPPSIVPLRAPLTAASASRMPRWEVAARDLFQMTLETFVSLKRALVGAANRTDGMLDRATFISTVRSCLMARRSREEKEAAVAIIRRLFDQYDYYQRSRRALSQRGAVHAGAIAIAFETIVEPCDYSSVTALLFVAYDNDQSGGLDPHEVEEFLVGRELFSNALVDSPLTMDAVFTKVHRVAGEIMREYGERDGQTLSHDGFTEWYANDKKWAGIAAPKATVRSPPRAVRFAAANTANRADGASDQWSDISSLPSMYLKRPHSPTTPHPIAKLLFDEHEQIRAAQVAGVAYWWCEAGCEVLWAEELPPYANKRAWKHRTSAIKTELASVGADATRCALAAALAAQTHSAAAAEARADCATASAARVLLLSSQRSNVRDENAAFFVHELTDAMARYTPLPLLDAVALLQLDCGYDVRGRARRTFDAFEQACITDGTGRGRIGVVEFCEAMERTMPQRVGAIEQREQRAFLVHYFQAHVRALPEEEREFGDTRNGVIPFAAACLGLTTLLLCPTHAMTRQVCDEAASEVHRIMVSHCLRMGGREGDRVHVPQFEMDGRPREIAKGELKYFFTCILTTEQLLDSSNEVRCSPVDLLAEAMSSAMLPDGGRRVKLVHADFFSSLVHLPAQLHPEVNDAIGMSLLEDMHAADVGPSVVDEPDRALEEAVQAASPNQSALPFRDTVETATEVRVPPMLQSTKVEDERVAWTVPIAWREHSTSQGARYFYNASAQITTWDAPPNIWVGAFDDQGIPYYYHTKTMERTWEDPTTVGQRRRG